MSGPFSLADALDGLTPKQRGDVMKEQEVIAVVQTAEYGKSKQKQTDQWSFEALMVDGEWEGETLEGTIYWSTKAATMATQAFAALGVDQEWIMSHRPTPDQIADKMVGAKFVGRVTVDEYRGRKRNRIEPKDYLGHESGGAQDYQGLEEFGAETASAAAANPAAVTPPAASKSEVPNGTAGATPTDLPAGDDADADDLWAAAQ